MAQRERSVLVVGPNRGKDGRVNRIPSFVRPLIALVAFAAVGLPARAEAKSDPKVDAFVTAFIASFEKSTGAKIPTSEATCIGTKFLAGVKLGDLLKATASNDLTQPQKAALTKSFGVCLSGATYKSVLKKNLAKQFTQGQLTCIGDKAVAQLGVPALIDLDFKSYSGVVANAATAAKTEAALTKIALACAKLTSENAQLIAMVLTK